MPNRDDMIDARGYWSMANIANHTHQGDMNCRCSTSAPIDGTIKLTINPDTSTNYGSSVGTSKWWDINNFNNLSPIYLTKDGSGITFDKPKIKEKKMSEFKREDFGINQGLKGRWNVKLKDKYLFLTTDGELSYKGDRVYNFLTKGVAEEALERFLNGTPTVKTLSFAGTSDHYGNVGDETEIKDLRGDILHVGDVVELFNTNGSWRQGSCGRKMIVEDWEKQFVMGVKCVDFTSGIGGSYAILKTKSYKELKVGENIDGIVVREIETKELTIEQIEEKLGYKVKVVGDV